MSGEHNDEEGGVKWSGGNGLDNNGTLLATGAGAVNNNNNDVNEFRPISISGQYGSTNDSRINNNFDITCRGDYSGYNNNSNRESEENKKERLILFGKQSRNKQIILTLCVLSRFMSGLSISLLAPFFPQIAQTKGMSITIVGFTFSLFPLTNFVASPIFAAHMTSVGPKLLLLSGMTVGGVCNLLYGTLDKCPSGVPFIATCLAVRFVEALGFSAFVNANLTIAANEFSEYAATVMALIQASSQIGTMVGPAFGGSLYDLGGFGTPFYVVGAFVVLNGFFLFLMIPSTSTAAETKTKPISKRLLFRNALVQTSLFTIATGSFGIGFLESTLANHLAPLSLSTTTIGLMFAIVLALFAIFSPILGYLTDTKGLHEYLIVLGHLVFGIGFFFIGPVLIFPGLELDNSVWSVTVGLVFIGASFGYALVPTMKCLILGATETGCGENLDTYAVVSGVLTSTYFLGSILGPLVGSVLVQQEGYAFAYTSVGGWCVFMCLLNLAVFVYRHHTSHNKRPTI